MVSIGGFTSLDGADSQNFNGAYKFLGALSAPKIDGKTPGDPWLATSKPRSFGVTSTHMEPLITYQMTVYEPSNYTVSEPMFGIQSPNQDSVVKVYTLAELNGFLERQYDQLNKKLQSNGNAGKRSYGDDTYMDTHNIVTENNFLTKIVFLGFIADSSHNPLGMSSGEDAPAIKSIVLHCKGKLDCAYLWGGGNTKTATQNGDHVGFVIKRMNKVNNILANSSTLPELVANIGPLQILPIASRRKEMFNALTISNNSDRVLDELIFGSHRESKSGVTGISASKLLFGYTADSYNISAYHRGTMFATIPDIVKVYTSKPGDTFSVVAKDGVVINAGMVMGVFSEVPRAEDINNAISFGNPNARTQTSITPRRRHDGIVTNISHALLQDNYGIHLFVHLPSSTYTMGKDFLN